MAESLEALEVELPQDKRDVFRQKVLAEASPHYNPYLHLGIPTIFGLCVFYLVGSQLLHVRWWEWLTVPAMFLIANASEWRIHRDMLHKRVPWAKPLYDQHTPMHHRVYVTRDMAMRSVQEWRLVLIPAYGIFLIAVAVFPLTFLLILAGLWNVGWLFFGSALAYVLTYEWLHLTYHLPPEKNFITRSKWIRILRVNHAIHHHPALMQKYNFNVTFPLWDRVRGSMAPPEVYCGVGITNEMLGLPPGTIAEVSPDPPAVTDEEETAPPAASAEQPPKRSDEYPDWFFE